MNCVRKLPTLQELVLKLYEPWLINIWCKLKYQPRLVYVQGMPMMLEKKLNCLETQVVEIMKEVFKDDIPCEYGREFQLMKIRKYLSLRPGKLLEIGEIFHYKNF